MNDEGITIKKGENFSEWYSQVVQKGELADYGPIQGTIAFRPYSYEIWEMIQKEFDARIKKLGHKNAYFPLLIPESLLDKEAEHFKTFVPEVFWVAYNGNAKLAEKYAIRPTSETIIYYFMSKWIRSWRDLPLLLNQWCNVLRAEIKATKPFIRTSEFLWQEGHTAHATKEDAEKEVFTILEIYKEIVEGLLAVPVIIGKKSEMEKFAGAVYTTTLEAMMPDGKALQCGTSHFLGQNFSKPFEVSFLDKEEKNDFVYTTSWGISTRLLGALIMVHGDDKGLVLPPKVAPIQAVIVPIYYNEQDKKRILGEAEKIKEELGSIRIEMDTREGYTPGWKFNYWELRGVPLRIEIGPKDIENNQVVISKRIDGKKEKVGRSELKQRIKEELENEQEQMFKKARASLDGSITQVRTFDEFKKVLETKMGFIKVSWCASKECEEGIKNETTATCRAIPFGEQVFSDCVYCGKKAIEVAFFAKSY